MLRNIWRALTIATICGTSLVKADAGLFNNDTPNHVTLDYNKNGVLRSDYQCDINFVNFGVRNDIYNIHIVKHDANDGKINLEVRNLKDANVGLNNEKEYTFTDSDFKKYIKIYQNGVEFTDFTVDKPNDSGYVTLHINGLNGCKDNNLTIKQTFKENANVASFLLYSNIIPNPKDVNNVFNIAEFGPSSNNVPYDTLKWKMNEGLENIMKKCRIYIDYKEMNNQDRKHRVWYLSTSPDNINGENCNNTVYYNTIKESFVNYKNMDDLFGDYYQGYVLKKEGSNVVHVDGVLVNNQKYIIEIYQNGCNEQNTEQVICTISSNDKLNYENFKNEFVENCLNVIIDENETPGWTIKNNGIEAAFNSYSLMLTNKDPTYGKLPKNESESITYKPLEYTYEGIKHKGGIARFNVKLQCGEGSYMGEKCRCNACPSTCTTCLSEDKCTGCSEGRILESDQCVCDAGYKEEEGVCVIDEPEPTEELTETVEDEDEKEKPNKVVVTKFKYVMKPVKTVRKCIVHDY